jgi:N-acetyl-anhydromuramyl-L-alanine amidase AmpD
VVLKRRFFTRRYYFYKLFKKEYHRYMFPKVFPHVKGLLQFDMSAKETFAGGKPIGAVVHYTADGDAAAGAASLVAAGLGYHLIVAKDGSVYQMASLTRKVWHAGKAAWRGHSPNQTCLAVALVSWGFLRPSPGDAYRTYLGTLVVPGAVAWRTDNRFGIVQPWDAATPAQTSALETILQRCLDLGMDPDMICGHDECALPAGRKMDPGGVLPYTMADLRKRLKDDRQGNTQGKGGSSV